MSGLRNWERCDKSEFMDVLHCALRSRLRIGQSCGSGGGGGGVVHIAEM